MFKLTVDQIFPKHSLKRKRKPVFVGESPSPQKNKKKQIKKKGLGKIEEETASPRAEEQEEPSTEPMDPEQ